MVGVQGAGPRRGAEEAESKPESTGPWRPHKGIGHDPKSETLCVREQSQLLKRMAKSSGKLEARRKGSGQLRQT